MLHLKSLVLAAVVAVAAPLFVTGCSDAGGEKPSEAQTVGTVEAALSTVGSDGATYQFLSGTNLVITTATSSESYAIDGPDTIFNKQLPVGSYNLEISWPFMGPAQLLRTEGMTSTVVDAIWTDSHPIPFTITQDTTTPIVLHFNVKGLGDITFDVGRLQVTIDVIQETVEEAAQIRESGSVNFYAENYADPLSAYAAALDVDTGVDIGQALYFGASGDWVQSGSQWVCKTGYMAALGYGSTGLFNRIIQTAGGDASVCIQDVGSNDWLYINFFRYGPAPSEQAAYLPDPNYSFNLYAQFPLGMDVYDGETLQQSLLTEWTPVDPGNFGHYIYDATYTTLLTDVAGVANAFVQFTP